jgi:hypothetical protein
MRQVSASTRRAAPRAALAAFVGWALSGQALFAQAPPCGLDAAPGSTLFLPYFEVDLTDVNGQTTLVSIANSSATSVLTKVTLWTDLGIPSLGFPLYLTGFDVATINLRDLFDGKLPRTASDGQDPSDVTSPQGPYSTDINFASCTGVLPAANLTAQQIADLRNEHQGKPSSRLGGLCSGRASTLQRARGFLTVDTVNNCTQRTPRDSGYFVAGGLGDATDQNVLWGDFIYLDASRNLAQGEALVRLQSHPTRFAGKPTFYNWLHGNTGQDGREPLPSSWATRFVNGGAFDGGTEMILWHAPQNRLDPFACTQPPFGVGSERAMVIDEQENIEFFDCIIGIPPPGCGQFAYDVVTTKVFPEFKTSFDFGWFVLQRGASPGSQLQTQLWVGSLMSAEGRFGVGMAGTPLDDGCNQRLCFIGEDCP